MSYNNTKLQEKARYNAIKEVKSGIKNGTTIQDFCQKWSCTPDELWERIGRLFTVKDTAKRIWHQIEANEKKEM